jgi:hypothetical protein
VAGVWRDSVRSQFDSSTVPTANSLVASPAQKNIGTVPRPRAWLPFGGCQPLGVNLELACEAGGADFATQVAEAVFIPSGGLGRVKFAGSLLLIDPRSSEQMLHVEGALAS